MSMTIIHKTDCTASSWKYILADLDLPSDTDEVTVKHIIHVTQEMRKKLVESYKKGQKLVEDYKKSKKLKEKQNGSNIRT